MLLPSVAKKNLRDIIGTAGAPDGKDPPLTHKDESSRDHKGRRRSQPKNWLGTDPSPAACPGPPSLGWEEGDEGPHPPLIW